MEPTQRKTPDLSQYFGVFFDEAEENLAQFERLLLEVDPVAPDDERVNAIFRAAHSIKGGSSTFGFIDMAAVTHELESLLDMARKKEILLTVEMIDALLASGDVLRLQLSRHRGARDIDEPDAAQVCSRIKRFTSGSAEVHRPDASDAADAPRHWEIRFPLEDSAQLPESLLAELREIAALDPPEIADGRCTLRIQSSAGENILRSMFFFFVEPSALEVVPVAEPDLGYGFFEDFAPPDPGYGFFEAVEPPKAADPGYGFFSDFPADVEAESDGRPAELPKPETVSRSARDSGAAGSSGDGSSIRVGTEKVDQLMNQIGELIITQAMLAQAVAKLDPSAHQNILTGMTTLVRNTRDLQESVMSVRMLPISFVFNRFPRMARDLSAKLGKQLQLAMEGETTELDKGLIEKISDPLTHLVRNAIDHGIETPDQRAAAGKPPSGTITLRASHQGGTIVIEVGDDGTGLRRDRILAKARERGLAVSDSMTDREVWHLIFEAGFSTAEQVTDVSGRGVGMDVVKRNIAELGGSVDIESTQGVGSRIIVRLPLTLAIIDGMSIAVGGNIYVIPLTSVVECLHASNSDVKSVGGGGLVVKVHSEFLPVVALRDIFQTGTPPPDTGRHIMLVVESQGVKNALLIDELLGKQQVVVKSLETHFRKVPGISGATIMGDGKVALILDVATLLKSAPR